MSCRGVRCVAAATISVVFTMAAVSGCARGAAQSTAAGPAIPKFGGSTSSAPSSTAGGRPGSLLPQDCDLALPHDQVPGLLGQPVDSVQVHTVIGILEPSVQRLERVSCRYDRVGQQPGTSSGDLLDMTMSAYSDVAAARDHTGVNIAAERKSATGVGVPSPIGDASGIYFVDGALRLLIVTYGRSALTVTLHSGVVPDTSARAILMDLAQRVLPVLAV